MAEREPLPYGPSYHKICEKVLINRKAGVYAMACFYFICTRADWKTGVMPNQLSHKALGEMFNASYNSIYAAIRVLREAGIIGYQERGNNYDGGDANIYRFSLPTPTHEKGSPPPTRRAEPHPREGRLNPYPSLSRGMKASPSGSAVGSDAVRPLGATQQNEELGQFSRDVRAHGYGRASELAKQRAAHQKEALRAAENKEGGKISGDAPREATQ